MALGPTWRTCLISPEDRSTQRDAEATHSLQGWRPGPSVPTHPPTHQNLKRLLLQSGMA